MGLLPSRHLVCGSQGSPMKKEIDVTAAIIVKGGKIFAARRKSGLYLAGYWEFPGGKLEEGESPKCCLARELKEER